MLRLKTVMLAAAAWLCLGAAGFDANAQEYPSKLVRVITPYAPGLSPDVATRVLTEKLKDIWNGQAVIIESRPGAHGTLAIGAAKKAEPDGYTLLLLGHSHLTINPVLLRKVPYDPVNDFVPIAMVYRTPFFICVAVDSPYKTVGDLIAAAKANPGKMSFATSYVGSPSHFAAALLAQLSDTEMLPVHYATEGTQAFAAVANGEIPFNLASIGSVAPFLKSGKLRLLATTAPNRMPDHPNLPTVSESGGPANYQFETWTGLFVMRGTPPDVVRRIRADVARALADPEMAKRFQPLGFVPAPERTPEQIVSLIRDDMKQNKELMERTGISLQ